MSVTILFIVHIYWLEPRPNPEAFWARWGSLFGTRKIRKDRTYTLRRTFDQNPFGDGEPNIRKGEAININPEDQAVRRRVYDIAHDAGSIQFTVHNKWPATFGDPSDEKERQATAELVQLLIDAGYELIGDKTKDWP